jgi:hypothetical protein
VVRELWAVPVKEWVPVLAPEQAQVPVLVPEPEKAELPLVCL